MLSFLRRARSDAIGNRLIEEVPEGGFAVQIQVTWKQSSTSRMTYFVDNYDESIGGAGNDGMYTDGQDTKLEQREIAMFWTFTPEILFQTQSSRIPGTPNNSRRRSGYYFLHSPKCRESSINHNNNAQNDLRSVDLRFQFRGTIRNICLNRISRFRSSWQSELQSMKHTFRHQRGSILIQVIFSILIFSMGPTVPLLLLLPP